MTVTEALSDVKNEMEAACKRAGRDSSDVTLIAVSKTKPVSMIEEALSAGINTFGENKVQELCEKYEALKDRDIHWHLIGHLQKNKVKKAVSVAEMIHSVDSIALAAEIQKEAAKINKTQNILLEVNVACEESKFGLLCEDVPDVVAEIAKFPNVHICGFMTVAPYTPNPEENRKIFAKLRELSVDIHSKNIDNVNTCCLSMGMSNDYSVAIEEGATFVRVGSKIFGERNYSI